MRVVYYVFKSIKLNLFLFICFIVTSLLSVGLSLFIPHVIGNFVNLLIKHSNKTEVYNLLLFLFSIWIVQIISVYIKSMVSVKLRVKTQFHMIFTIVKHVKKLPLLFFNNNESAYLAHKINMDTANLLNFFLNTVFSTFINIFSSIIIIITMLKVNVIMAVGISFLIPLYIVIHLILNKPLSKSTSQLKENNDIFFSALNNQILYIKHIKVQSIYEETDEFLFSKFQPVYYSAVKTNKFKLIYKMTELLAKYFVSIAIFIYSANQIISGTMNVGEFTVLNTYVGMLISSISCFLSFGSTYIEAEVSYNRVMDLLNNKVMNDGFKSINKVDTIKIQNLSFQHYDSSALLINKLTYTFNMGNIYTIIGDNGAGKTTLLLLLLGLIENYSGSIYYNDYNIIDVNMYKMRKKHVAVVTQTPDFFYNTVGDNINFSDISFNSIIDYASVCNLDNWLQNFTEMRNDILLLPTSSLSGGEKQRFSLLRALVKNADVLLLDEPSSAMDKNSIEKLIFYIKKIKKDKIIIIITHDNKLISISDEQLRL